MSNKKGVSWSVGLGGGKGFARLRKNKDEH